MKGVLAAGVVIVILGVLAFFVPVPHSQHEGVSAGKFHAGVETTQDEKLPPSVGAVMVAVGGALIVAGARRG